MNKKKTSTNTIAHPSTTSNVFPLGSLDGRLLSVDVGPNIATAVSARVSIIGISRDFIKLARKLIWGTMLVICQKSLTLHLSSRGFPFEALPATSIGLHNGELDEKRKEETLVDNH